MAPSRWGAVRPALEFDNIEAIKDAVSAGLGMAIVPSPAITCGPPLNSIVARPLEPPLIRTLGVILRRNNADDPVLRVVRDEILTLANIRLDSEHPSSHEDNF